MGLWKMNSMARRKGLGRYAKKAPPKSPPPGINPPPPPPGINPPPSPGVARGIKNPRAAMAALNKLAKKLPKEKQKQLEKGVGNVLGGNLDKVNQDQGNQIQNLLSQMGLTGPGGPGGPGINPPGPPPPPVGINPPPQTGGPRVSNPNTFFGGQQQPQQPQLNLGAAQGGAMAMAPQAQPPTLGQTVQQQKLAKQQQGGGTQTGTGGTTTNQSSGLNTNNNNLTASSNTTPAVSSPNYGTGTQFGAGPMTPGVTTGQLQDAVTGSSLINTGPATAGQIFQAQYNPMINMAGRADIMNQISTPGRSNVGGQYGTGGIANIAQQMAANQAAQQGIQGAQGLIAGNVQQQLGAQQLGSQFDLANRQQQVQHLGAMLQPAAAGAAAGFGQAIQGMTKMPQFLG